MSVKVRNILLFWLETLMIFAILVLAVLPFSCKVTESGIKIMDGDYVCPKLLSYCVEDARTLKINFSEKVELKSHVICDEKKSELKSDVVSDMKTDVICLKLHDASVIGNNYSLLGVVKDEYGNSLTFELPFKGFNERVPSLIMTEIQTTTISSQKKDEAAGGFYRTEFVELLALTDGNLSGIELVSANDGEDRRFELPPVEVKQGEVIVVHLRNKGNGCINEDGDNLSLANAPYSTNGVRDLWTSSTDPAIGNKTDVVFLRNTANGDLLDALLFCDSKYDLWPSKFERYVNIVKDASIFESTKCSDVIIGDDLAKTTTLQRINAKTILEDFKKNKKSVYPVKNSAKDWQMKDNTAGYL